MAKRQAKTTEANKTAELVRDLIIVQLGLAGIGQREIRDIVGADINHINRIIKLLRKKTTSRRKGR